MGEKLDDNQLMLAARSGDRRAFEILVSRYQPHLLRYASRTVGDHRADDVLQHVWIRAWKWTVDSNKQLPENVKPWLYRITHNQALNHLRDHPAQAGSEDHFGIEGPELACHRDVHHQVETQARTRDMLGSLGELPERQAQALIMHAAHGLSHEEIARQTGDNPHAVRGLIFRARAQMREKSLAWAGALLPFPWIHKTMSRWQHHGFSPAEQTAAGVSGAAGTGITAALSSGGSALVASSASKVALVVAAGTVAVGGTAVVKKAEEHSPAVMAKAASPKSTEIRSGSKSSGTNQSPTASLQKLVGQPPQKIPARPDSKAATPSALLPVAHGKPAPSIKPEDQPETVLTRKPGRDEQTPRWQGNEGGRQVIQNNDTKQPRWQIGGEGRQSITSNKPPRWQGSSEGRQGGKGNGEGRQNITSNKPPRWQSSENGRQGNGWKQPGRQGIQNNGTKQPRWQGNSEGRQNINSNERPRWQSKEGGGGNVDRQPRWQSSGKGSGPDGIGGHSGRGNGGGRQGNTGG